MDRPSSLSGVHSSPDALCVLLLEPRFDVGASVADSVADLEAWWSAVAAVSVVTQGGPRDSGHLGYLFEEENVGHVVLKELTDLARILRVRASHLAATETDFKLEMVQNDVVAHSGAVARLQADIDELNQMLAEKTQAYENARKLLLESQEEYRRLLRVNGEH